MELSVLAWKLERIEDLIVVLIWGPSGCYYPHHDMSVWLCL